MLNIDSEPNLSLLSPLGNFTDIHVVYFKEQSFLNLIRVVCTWYMMALRKNGCYNTSPMNKI